MSRHWKASSILLLGAMGLPLISGSVLADDIEYGLWEMQDDTTIEMQGRTMNIPSDEPDRACFSSRKQLLDTLMNPERGERQPDCEQTLVENEGGRIVYTVSCKQGNAEMTGKTALNFDGDQMTGEMHMQGEDPNQGQVKFTSQLSGQRVGPCEEGQ